MELNPKLSIITINYNNASGLERTIKSVLAQTYENIEYIVVDGASSDGSVEVLNKYKSKIDIAISEPDRGIYNAMNKGARLAQGEYLLFINSGDVLYTKDTIKNCNIETFDTDIVSGRVYNSSPTALYLKSAPEKVTLFTFIGGSLPHPSSFIKKDLFDRVGGYIEEYRIISDWCFFVDATLVHNCSYATIKDIIVVFEWGGISSTTNDSDNKIEFLRSRFGRIVDDYLPLGDEAIANVGFWASATYGLKGDFIRFPFKVINRLLKLRNRLGRRMGSTRIPVTTLNNDETTVG